MKKDARKPATIIAEFRRANNELHRSLNAAANDIHAWRGRATKAEQECADWRRRFDLLLARTPESGPGHPSEPRS